MNNIVLFDGVCNFCDSSVQYIIKRDPLSKFRFAAIESPIGNELKEQYDIKDSSSIVLIQDGKQYTKSTAVLKIAKELKGPTKLLYAFVVIPKPLRDIAYAFIAKNRYKWFGQKETCRIPTPAERSRFL